LNKLAFKNPIPAGATRSGLLFVNPEHGTRVLNVDLFQARTLIPFTLFLRVPDDAPDSLQNAFQYPASEIKDYQDLAGLRSALERLPCCATDARGEGRGDPLNAVAIGYLPSIGAAIVRRDYRREPLAFDSTQHVFGREPDFVLRKQSQVEDPATWIRVWLTPIRFQGQSVYVVQVGRPVGGRFAMRHAENLVLDKDVDQARNFLIQDMMYSGGLDKLGFVVGAGEKSNVTLNAAHYYTDGLRAVVFFATRPLSLSDVQFLDWEHYLDRGHDDASK
jgi:hypothetical protein